MEVRLFQIFGNLASIAYSFISATIEPPTMPRFNCSNQLCEDDSTKLLVACNTSGGPLDKTYCSYDGSPLQSCKFIYSHSKTHIF